MKFLPIRVSRPVSPVTIVRSILTVLGASVIRPSVVHIHAVGSTLVASLARSFGLNVVVTHRGPGYDREKYRRQSTIIPDGGPLPALYFRKDVLDIWDLEAKKCVLLVSRFSPEKRHLDLIEALEKSETGVYTLALVDGANRLAARLDDCLGQPWTVGARAEML